MSSECVNEIWFELKLVSANMELVLLMDATDFVVFKDRLLSPILLRSNADTGASKGDLCAI